MKRGMADERLLEPRDRVGRTLALHQQHPKAVCRVRMCRIGVQR